MGERENDVAVWHRQQIITRFIHPNLFFNTLANGAIAIATRVENVYCMATILTNNLPTTEPRRATLGDVSNRFLNAEMGFVCVNEFFSPSAHNLSYLIYFLHSSSAGLLN